MLDGHDTLYYRFGVDKALDQQILHYLSGQRVRRLKTAYPPHTIVDPTILIHEMRLHKTEDEAELMQTAATISAEAHILVMQKVNPGMNEFQVESLIEAYMRDNGATGVAYNSIIGGGENATILHYVENNRELKDGDLILIDAGAEYHGLCGGHHKDFPVNGNFTKPQREIYDVVLEVQEACVEDTKTGNTVKARQELSIELLTEGMKKLGLLKGKTKDLIKKKEYMRYYMHGVGHYLGLDVHDAGRYFADQTAKNSRPFAPGMVLTVEPGLYIPPDDKNAPAKYRGIGVRIEDDVLVTEEGNRNLTAKVPKDADEIEALMAAAKKARRARRSILELGHPARSSRLAFPGGSTKQTGAAPPFLSYYKAMIVHRQKPSRLACRTARGHSVYPIRARQGVRLERQYGMAKRPLFQDFSRANGADDGRDDHRFRARHRFPCRCGNYLFSRDCLDSDHILFRGSWAFPLWASFSDSVLQKIIPGAAVLVPYFILLLILIFLTNPFIKLKNASPRSAWFRHRLRLLHLYWHPACLKYG